MSDESPELLGKETAVAISETAKFGTKFLESAEKAGSFGASVLGSLPHDVVGVIGADWLRHFRARRCAKFISRTLEVLAGYGVSEPYAEVSGTIGKPLLEAAVDETREELLALWAKLLAAAMDPKRAGRVRSSFIAILKQMDPLDAKVLQAVSEGNPGATNSAENSEPRAAKLNAAHDEILMSLSNLQRLDCIENMKAAGGDRLTAHMKPTGRLLLFALR
jgi:hypothetical protein